MRRGESGYSRSGRERIFALPPYFYSSQVFDGLGGTHPPRGGPAALPSADSLANLFQKRLQTARNNHREPFSPVKVTHKINLHEPS